MTGRRANAAPQDPPPRRATRPATSSRTDFGPAWLRRRLAALLPEWPAARLCVAFSGGLDSTALLAALVGLRELRGRVRAVHVDHHLLAQSGRWAVHCAAIAARFDVPFVVRDARIELSRGDSVEAAARAARYALLAAEQQPGEVLLTAHHEDDQAETFLLQLLRGAGLGGLSAMPDVANLGSGRLVRPLLPVSRAALERWLESRGIAWVDDPSNADERFDRNFLRLKVLPGLRARWPAAAPAIARAAGHLAEAKRLLDSLAQADAERASDGVALSAASLRALDAPRRRNAVRWWLAAAGAPMPGTRRLQQIIGPMLDARPDANPSVSWEGVTLARETGRLILSRAGVAEKPAAVAWRWRPGRPLALPGGGTLCIRRDVHGPLDLDALPRELSVARRAGGERLRPRRSGPTRTLKQLLQETRMPPGERARVPLVFAGGRLVAAGDRWLDASVQAGASTADRGRFVWSREARAPSA